MTLPDSAPLNARAVIFQQAEVGAAGYVNQVAGDQNIYQRDLLRASGVQAEELQVVRSSQFVPNDGLEGARMKIRQFGVAVLVGPDGVGKRTAALKLLAEFIDEGFGGDTQNRLAELIADWDKPSTSGLPAAPATGYLLDLGGELLGLPEKFAKGLLEHASQLRDVQSCLVISVTPESWRECAESGSVIAQEIKQPDGLTVAERRLDALSDSPERLKWLGLGFVRAALPPHVGPADAVRLAKKLAELDPANGF